MGLDLEQRMRSSIFMCWMLRYTEPVQLTVCLKNVEQKARKTACNISALEPQNHSLTGDKYVQIVCELAVCGCNCMCFSGCIGSVPNSSCFVASAPVGLSVAAALIEKGGPYPGDR